MSDSTKSGYTKSEYTKTGEKVMCINSNRRDLTYKKVYDVFVDNDGYKFVIDDSCYRLYDNMEFPFWIEVFDKGFDSITSKPQFNVGDKVKVVDIEYISNTTDDIKLGDVGVIVNINDNPVDPYRVKFNETDEKDCRWFTDKCIELVNDDVENTPTKSESVVVRKFKVGDLVRVTSTDYISQYDTSIEVGDIEVIIDVVDDDKVPYQIGNWWFPESDLELVEG